MLYKASLSPLTQSSLHTTGIRYPTECATPRLGGSSGRLAETSQLTLDGVNDQSLLKVGVLLLDPNLTTNLNFGCGVRKHTVMTILSDLHIFGSSSQGALLCMPVMSTACAVSHTGWCSSLSQVVAVAFSQFSDRARAMFNL